MEGKLLLQILVLTCFWWNCMPRANSHDEFQSVLTTVVDDHYLKSTVYPNYRISGPNGYCIDVKDGNFSSGVPIIVWTCRPSRLNQMWTFESDGTIRANDMCLTTRGFTHGSYITIYDCSTAPVQDAIIWELRSNGEIVNPKSGLVVTAIPPKAGTTLTVQSNIHSSFQTWRVGNDTTPSLVWIIGLDGLCLRGSHDEVCVEECVMDNVRQEWLIYPDGTIRTKKHTDWCLGYDNLVSGRVVVQFCGLGPSGQRWLFTEEGTILNERVNLVMDVKNSDPSVKEIIVYRATGRPNQKWEILPP